MHTADGLDVPLKPTALSQSKLPVCVVTGSIVTKLWCVPVGASGLKPEIHMS